MGGASALLASAGSGVEAAAPQVGMGLLKSAPNIFAQYEASRGSPMGALSGMALGGAMSGLGNSPAAASPPAGGQQPEMGPPVPTGEDTTLPEWLQQMLRKRGGMQ